MFSNLFKNKNGLWFNVGVRIFMAYPLVFITVGLLSFYILSSNTDEIKFNLREYNIQIQNTINNKIFEIKKELEIYAKHSGAHDEHEHYLHGVDVRLAEELFGKNFNAYYFLDENSSVIYEKKDKNAYNLNSFNGSWIQQANERTPLAISHFIVRGGHAKAIFVAYYVSKNQRIVAELKLDEIFKSIANILNEHKHSAYIFDVNGNIIKSIITGGSQSEISGKQIDVFDVDQYFTRDGEISFSYLKMQAELVSYNENLDLFVLAFTPRYDTIALEFLLLAIAFISFVFYTFLAIKNVGFAKQFVRKPVDEINAYIVDQNVKPDVEFLTEFQNIYDTLQKLYGELKNRDENLQDYKQRFGYIFEQSPLIIVVYDAYDGRIVDVSKRACEFYGYDYDELVGRSCKDIFLSAYEQVLFEIRKSIDSENSSFVARNILKNQEIKNVSMQGSVISANDRKYVFIIVNDITQSIIKKQNENNVMRYYSAFNDIVMVSQSDDVFKICYTTPNIDKLLGISEQDVADGKLNLKDLIFEADRIGFINEFELAKRFFIVSKGAKDVLNFVVRLKTPKVNSVYYKINVKFFKDVDGNFDSVAYHISEFAEQKVLADKFDLEQKAHRNLLWASETIRFEYDAGTDIMTTGGEFASVLGIDGVTGNMVIDQLHMKRIIGDSFINFDTFFAGFCNNDGAYIGEIKAYDNDKNTIWLSIKAKQTLVNKDGSVHKIEGVFRNITDKKIAQAYQGLASRLFSYSKDEIAIFDKEWKFIDVNENFCREMGYELDEIVGLSIHTLDSKLTNVAEYENILKSTQDDGVWQGRIWIRTKNGDDKYMLLNFCEVGDKVDDVVYYIGIFSQVGEIRTTQDYLDYIAYHDPLTKLPNRFLFNQRLNEALKEQEYGKQVAIAYLNFDGFKAINDTYGNEVGDKFLTEISSKIDILFQERDMFARIGGDEFVAIIVYESVGEVYEMASNILRIACSNIRVDGVNIGVSASMGVSINDAQMQISPEDMLEQANWAMYQAKLSGKNRYYVFDASKDKNLKDQYVDNHKILTALENNELFVEYQPEINLQTGQIVSFEALIRWNNNGTIVYPEEFLPLVKQQNIIEDIAIFTISQALKAQAAWQAAGKNASVGVNINIAQLCSESFYIKFKELANNHSELNLSALFIEIIDSNNVENLAQASRILQKYKSFGVSFILDDFASKTSPFEALELLPIDKLKVDKNICNYIFFNKKAFSTARIIKNVADMFSKAPTIKNLQDTSTLKILSGLGFSNFQGNFFAPPMSLEKVLKYEFRGIDGFNANYHIDDKLFDKLSECIMLKEYAQGIISLLSSRSFASDDESFAGLRHEILPKLDEISTSEYLDIVSKLKDALHTNDKMQTLSLARTANIMCSEILNFYSKENM